MINEEGKCEKCGGQILEYYPEKVQWDEAIRFVMKAKAFEKNREDILSDEWMHPGVYCENCGCLALVNMFVFYGPPEPCYSIVLEPAQLVSVNMLTSFREVIKQYSEFVPEEIRMLNSIQLKKLLAENCSHKVFASVYISQLDHLKSFLQNLGVKFIIQQES